MTWRLGLMGVLLLSGCEARRPTPPAPPATKALQPVTAADPRPQERAAPGHGPDAGATATAGASEGLLSPDRRLALVLQADASAPHIEVQEANRREPLTRIAIDDAAAVRASASRLRWTAGGHILLTWGSGSNTAHGVVYDTRGARLLDVAGAALSVSPTARYLATYPTLFANNPVIRVYDLTTGRQVAQREASEDTAWVVESVEWQGQHLLARYRDTREQRHELRIPLDRAP